MSVVLWYVFLTVFIWDFFFHYVDLHVLMLDGSIFPRSCLYLYPGFVRCHSDINPQIQLRDQLRRHVSAGIRRVLHTCATVAHMMRVTRVITERCFSCTKNKSTAVSVFC